jgi:hypothetical protein
MEDMYTAPGCDIDATRIIAKSLVGATQISLASQLWAWIAGLLAACRIPGSRQLPNALDDRLIEPHVAA